MPPPAGREPFEPERYELTAGPAYRFEVDRRAFVKLLGTGLVVWLGANAAGAQPRDGGGDGAPEEIAAWLHVAADGTITAYTGKVEFGQDIRTSLTQAVAEELRAPLDAVRLVMGDTDLTPFDMGTFGSRTTPVMAPQLRKMAAAAREALVDLAAERWGVGRESLRVEGGRVAEAAGGRSAGFGELTDGRKLVRRAAEVAITPPGGWTIAGRSVPKVNARELVTGAHRYTSDLTRPGMWHGKVLRPPAVGATLGSLDDAAAKATGAVVVRDGGFAGVAAPTPVAARRALQELRAEWKAGAAMASQAELFASLKTTPPPAGERGSRPSPAHETGSVAPALAGAAHRLQQSYTVAYIAHAPLEPRAAVAEWTGGKLTVWTGTQR
ncbi:MAG TPA: molybdopterin cofactor-binding domain-containing protein, partial [Vicinamibacteria bacterium]